MTSKLLNEYPLIVLPSLATKIGLNNAIVLQQIHYWLQKSKTDYVYNTYEGWQENFPFWSTKTIQRTITELENQGILVSYQDASTDRKKYYKIDYYVLEQILHEDNLSSSIETDCPDATPQNDLLLITETTTETTSENNKINSIDEFEKQFQIIWEQETGKLIAGMQAFGKMVDRFRAEGVTPEDYRIAIREQNNSDYPVKNPTSVENWALSIAKLRKTPVTPSKINRKASQLDMSKTENRSKYNAWVKDD